MKKGKRIWSLTFVFLIVFMSIMSTATPLSQVLAAEIEQGFKFSFGENPKDGFIRIDKSSNYSSETGNGLENSSEIQTSQDAISGSEILFRVDLPVNDYSVSLVAPHTMDTAKTKVFVNNVEIKKSWVQQDGENILTFKFALIDDSMNFRMTGEPNTLSELTITPLPKRTAGEDPSIFLISDSTVRNYEIARAPMTGWGQVLDRLFQPEIKIKNRAMGGRSTRTAYAEGRLNDLLVDVKPGDYVFIQFAHNDEAVNYPDRYVTVDEYKSYLNNYYVKGAIQRGAIPVALTSMNRRTFKKDIGAFVDSFPAYTQAMKEVAAENNLVLLDLNTKSLEYYNELGYEGTASIFMQLKPGENPNYPTGSNDNTHFKEAGAKQMARMIVEEINDKIPALAQYSLPYHKEMREVFKDTETVWEREQIEKMALLGVMSGVGENFKPEREVRLKDYVEMLEKLTGLQPNELGLENIDQRPELLTRENAVSLALDAYSLKKNITPPEGNLNIYSDNGAVSPNLVNKVASAAELKLIISDKDNLLHPKAVMTKKDTAVLLYKIYIMLNI
ncbi:rhamnogalacturonan acetylesterase [Bacillus solitudinis]|uniref:rhamnogalacturonan acetylesterase n=1 Tax=Bacillus solitudinis TaxID=2014074 RepID=UPI000C2419C8|nr:rhamnogalacturonan acetylesterase [Bacillus solitudinis]